MRHQDFCRNLKHFGVSQRKAMVDATAPAICANRNAGTSTGLMPAKVFDAARQE
jgi:hypothetical protein